MAWKPEDDSSYFVSSVSPFLASSRVVEVATGLCRVSAAVASVWIQEVRNYRQQKSSLLGVCPSRPKLLLG
jgi:hypothetical protein